MHPGLHQLFQADRADHAEVPPAGTEAYAALRARDALRRAQAEAFLADLADPSAEDLYHAAWLFNHGDTPAEAWRGHDLAAQAVALGHPSARWLFAATHDRARMYEGRPQTYGTQIVPDGTRHRVWDVEPGTTDAERAALGVPPLAELHRRAEALTGREPQPPMDAAPEWLKAAILRWRKG